jgi:hypothetical protein
LRCIQRWVEYLTKKAVLQFAFDYEHEHRFTEHEHRFTEYKHRFTENEHGAANPIHRYKSKPATKNPEEPFHLAFIE